MRINQPCVPVVTGTQGLNGWYTSNATVIWREAADVSGLASAQCVADLLSADTTGRTFTCSVTSGAGLKSTGTVTISRDTTPPVISGLPPQEPAISGHPTNSLITVANVTAADSLSGIATGSLQVTATSNAASNKKPAIVINNGVVQLRATVNPGSSTCTYAINATATDLAGETSTATTQCKVARPMT